MSAKVDTTQESLMSAFCEQQKVISKLQSEVLRLSEKVEGFVTLTFIGYSTRTYNSQRRTTSAEEEKKNRR